MNSENREKRSEIMRTVKSKHTKLEQKFYNGFGNEASRFSWNPQGIIGNPDFVNEECRVAIFLDSCFWHGCSRHFRLPKTNQVYWQEKIKRNKKRDRYVTKCLRNEGWTVFRIWEHAIRTERDLTKSILLVSNHLKKVPSGV